MGKRRAEKKRNRNQESSLSGKKLVRLVESLIRQKRYSEALNKLPQIRRRAAELEITPAEENLWSLRGQQEWAQGQLRQAEKSFRQALGLGLNGEAHYWLAKCLLSSERLEEAVELFRRALETEVLPTEYAGCYLKLLFLVGETATIQELISNQQQRFEPSQLHWARGMVALQAGELESALKHWQKMEQPATPDDCPEAWLAYGHQQMSNWSEAESLLGSQRGTDGVSSSLSETLPSHPAKQRLLVVQATARGDSLRERVRNEGRKLPNWEAILVLEMLRLMEAENFHEAAHVALKLPRPCRQFPEVEALYRPLMVLAGEQAWREGERECTQEFWGSIVAESPFDPQLVVRLNQVSMETGAYRRSQRLLKRLVNWLKQEGQQNPAPWPSSRLNQTLAQLYCQLADSCMAVDERQKGFGFLRSAERLCPNLPEVVGRQGLRAYAQGQTQESISLLTKALESGCRYEEVYTTLLECFQTLGDSSGRGEVRRRFGKQFGDLTAELEIEVPAWVEALSQTSYGSFARLTMAGRAPEPALEACRIFVQEALDEPNRNQRVTLGQEEAAQQWSQLLESLEPKAQIPVLQALGLSLLRFAKRKKGLAGLINQYVQKLLDLSQQEPEAQLAYLILLVVKGVKPEQWQATWRQYLERASQPETALAQLQLKVRRFAQTEALLPFLEEALRRQPQNPLLLLAKATVFPADSPEYQKLSEEGFELARRLQDGQALKAWRSESAFQSSLRAEEKLLEISGWGDNEGLDLAEILQNLARQLGIEELSPEILEKMLPELKRLMSDELPEWSNESNESDESDDYRFPFGRPSRSKKSSKRQRGFQR